MMSLRHTFFRPLMTVVFLCLASVGAKAQESVSLRDSLAAAAEILSYHPDSLDLRLKKAAWNIELQQWEYAKGEYDYVLSRQPENVAALFFRAYVNERLGRYQFARLDYEKLLTLVPGNFEAQLGLALLNQKDKHYTEAFDQINSLVEQFSERPEAYAARAGIEKERGMKELAVYDYLEAVRLSPSTTDYRVAAADLLIDLGRNFEARQQLDALVSSGVSRAVLRDFYRRIAEK